MSEYKYQEEYMRRIHKVQDYIEQNLGRSLSIEELSDEAGFSKYHFSRIFQGILNEPLAHYVNRIRMEKILFMLAHRPDKNMTDIAYELGFSDSAVFSRAFKKCYGVTPREYRNEYSKNCKDLFVLSEYNKSTANKKKEDNLFQVKGQITFENLNEKQVAYVRHIGTYETLGKEYNNLMYTLFTLVKKQGFLVDDQSWLLVMYHDNPEFAEENQFRTSLCITIPEGREIQEDSILGGMKLEGGLYAVGHFQIQQEQYGDAWDYMYQEWISESGYVPRNCYPFEVYRNDASSDENGIHKVDIYVPIEPFDF